MLIEIHAIQNHSPANLNRDDLGAPKTCYFGGALRSRISSQCLKRSIRMSDAFSLLRGAVRTRRLAQLLGGEDEGLRARAAEVLRSCGIAPKEKSDSDSSAGLVFVTSAAINEMKKLLQAGTKKDKELAKEFAQIIAHCTAAPDMALSGRMLEPKSVKGTADKDKESKDADPKDPDNKEGVWKGLKLGVEAALQVAHAISTHEARPEVDYYVAADDIPGADAGAGFVDEAMFASACFYKYFSIDWDDLVRNLTGFDGDRDKLAAHTVGAFIKAAALANPTGKQNAHAAHNPPDGILIEIRNNGMPINYANAFAKPVNTDERSIIDQSIAQLARYISDLDVGYGKPDTRFWFSPNNRHSLSVEPGSTEGQSLADRDLNNIDELVSQVVNAIGGFDWDDVRRVVISPEDA